MLRNQYQHWTRTLDELNPWFSNFVPELESLRNGLFRPIFDSFCPKNAKDKLVAPMDDHTMFKHFTQLFEIFLNELRKYALLTNTYKSINTPRQQIDSSRLNLMPPRSHLSISSHRSSTSNVLNHPQIESIAPSPRVSILIEKKKALLLLQGTTEDHHIGRAGTPRKNSTYNKGNTDLVDILQCLYVQSMVMSIGNLVNENHRHAFHEAMVRCIRVYSATLHKPMARGILERLEETPMALFDSFYDLMNGQWKSFKAYQPNLGSTITDSFELEEFIASEKGRFLPEYLMGQGVGLKQEEVSRLFCLTQRKRKACFVLQHLIAYKKNVMLIAQPQQGKSLFMEYFARRAESIKLILDSHTTKRQVTEYISTDTLTFASCLRS